MQANRIRFGYSDSIHLLPLLHPLQAGWVYPTGHQLDLVALPAPELERALGAGELDGGLLDPLAYQRLRGALEVMPGIGLASDGPNGMAVLQSVTRPDDLDGQEVAVDPSAAGGVAAGLLAVLAPTYFSIAITTAQADPPARAGVPRLLAGDAAVRARLPWLLYEARFSPSTLAAEERALAKGRPLPTPANPAPAPDPATAGWAEDLGAAWWILSGTPMVWALGVLRRELLDQPETVVAIVRAFQQSRTAAQEQADTVRAAAAAQAGVPGAVVSAIFDRQTVELGASQQGGLAAFYAQAARLRV
ncbi:MAG TPA: MqnA/MqnD/SBP family protein [Chloroflexia bacterium]|nr:MqnA/MqnD/SBP family protein [Chloroflexia bacterium]